MLRRVCARLSTNEGQCSMAKRRDTLAAPQPSKLAGRDQEGRSDYMGLTHPKGADLYRTIRCIFPYVLFPPPNLSRAFPFLGKCFLPIGGRGGANV